MRCAVLQQNFPGLRARTSIRGVIQRLDKLRRLLSARLDAV
jgi:hypothetical protein